MNPYSDICLFWQEEWETYCSLTAWASIQMATGTYELDPNDEYLKQPGLWFATFDLTVIWRKVHG